MKAHISAYLHPISIFYQPQGRSIFFFIFFWKRRRKNFPLESFAMTKREEKVVRGVCVCVWVCVCVRV